MEIPGVATMTFLRTALNSVRRRRGEKEFTTPEFLKRARWELREVWMVRVWKDRYQLIDVNKDYFEIRGIGYPDTDVVPLLRDVNAAFDPATIHDPTDAEYKEFLTGRRFPC